MTGLSRTGVFDICKRHQALGAKGLRAAPGGRKPGQGRSLDVTQELLVRQLIADKTPDQLKMPYALWTCAAVGQLIEQCFGIRLAVRTVGLYLSRWGFTPQKPMRKAYEQSPAAVKKWLEHDSPVIAARAQSRRRRDSLGRRERAAQRRRARAQLCPQGARVSNKRHGLSVISTVTNKGEMRWKIFDGALNADILIDFMQRLIRGAKKKIFLVLENLRVHHAKPVKEWLQANKERIEVFYLPSYSPELNPDEMLNADLKQAVTKLAPARTKLQLVKATSSHLRSVQRQPARVRKYFEHEPIRYAA
ncbi:IS630 family transposase [Ralstonia solanacearum]|uniref:IS630 family transposase n=1 Tax=Ralstonia solanacearum TaxID=305 RepID=UPI003CC6B7B5